MRRRIFIRNGALASVALGTLPLGCSPKLDTDILILGGGMAGLKLAYELEQAGRDYIILEGSPRMGGRLFSHPTLGRDVGGRGIGDRYDEVMKVVKALDVELVDITENMSSPSAIYLKGELHNPWEGDMAKPSFLEFSKLRNAKSLESLDAWYQSPQLDKPYSEFLKDLGHTDEEIALINISTNYNDVFKTSALNSLHSRAFRKYNGSKKVFNFKGGAKNLVNKIVDALQHPVYTDKMVTEIDDQQTRVTVRCEDGSSYSAKKVVCTIPFSTLRDVKLNAELTSNQEKAIKELQYTRITQIHFDAEPFWEEDGIPPSMWTDTPLERIMDVNAASEEVKLACWVNGTGADYFKEMSDAEIADFTMKTMAKIRPASEGKISYLGTHKWGSYRYNKGAYCEFGVGQAALFEDMIRPSGNLHFAGEHAAKESRGIEAAAESAVRVFNELNQSNS